MAGMDPVLGFVTRTLEDLVDQVGADCVAELSPALDISASSPMGQLIGVVMKPAAELWDLAQATYVAGDPDRNTGDGQDAVCAITGTTRDPASHSQVRQQLTLDPTTTVPIGSQVSVVGNPATVFELVGTEDVEGTVVVEDLTSVAGGDYFARLQAVNTGPVAANSGTLTVIVTPVVGWTATTNALDATIGHDVETSSALRVRRELELAQVGSTPVDALRGELYRFLSDNDNAGFVDVVENEFDVVDADGRPPHSVEVLIDDGISPLDDDDIAQVIWDGKAGGIQTFGATTGTAVDDLGVDQPINFNRPTLKPVYFIVQVGIDTVNFPADGDDQIKAAMAAFGDLLKPGQDVVRNSFFGPVFSITGVVTVPVLNVGFSPAPGFAVDLVVGVRERATFDTSNIVIVHL